MSSKPFCLRAGLAACVLIIPAIVISAERRPTKTDAAPAETVEMFAAIESGDIDVSFVPKDSSQARVAIKNKTKKPLNVKLPDAFAGVPVLAQRAAAGGARPGAPGGGQQAMGGGMGGGGMGMGGGGMGMGGGFMNIPAEKVGQFKVATVCLEHGKREPKSSIAYEIKPIESFTTQPGIKELLTHFGKQQLDQRTVQAAAWHLSSGMSWEDLLNKQIEHVNGTSEPWFSQAEIQAAMQVSQVAETEAQQRAQTAGRKSQSLEKSSGQE